MVKWTKLYICFGGRKTSMWIFNNYILATSLPRVTTNPTPFLTKNSWLEWAWLRCCGTAFKMWCHVVVVQTYLCRSGRNGSIFGYFRLRYHNTGIPATRIPYDYIENIVSRALEPWLNELVLFGGAVWGELEHKFNQQNRLIDTETSGKVFK